MSSPYLGLCYWRLNSLLTNSDTLKLWRLGIYFSTTVFCNSITLYYGNKITLWNIYRMRLVFFSLIRVLLGTVYNTTQICASTYYEFKLDNMWILKYMIGTAVFRRLSSFKKLLSDNAIIVTINLSYHRQILICHHVLSYVGWIKSTPATKCECRKSNKVLLRLHWQT